MVAPYMADEVRPLVTSAPSALQVHDHPFEEGMTRHFVNLSTPPSSELTEELDGAAEWLGVRVEEILLAALGRALGRTRGEGAVDVDVTGEQRRWFHTVSLICSDAPTMGPTEMLQGAHTALAAEPGLQTTPSEVLLDVAAHRSDAGGGHLLELRVYRVGGLLQFDWVYDVTRFDDYSIEELAEQFPLALIEITSDAAAPL